MTHNLKNICVTFGLGALLLSGCDNPLLGGLSTIEPPNATAGVCGDGVKNSGESCDDGEETATCNEDCSFAVCGDGQINAAAGETCDDANGDNTDDCPDGENGTCTAAECGDGFVWAGHEPCDDGNSIETDDCLNTCVSGTCGDGEIQAPGEQCDDGVGNSNSVPDACRENCLLAHCGDDVPDTGEPCDDGIDNSDDWALVAHCDANCTGSAPHCGDGNPDAGDEICDDNNTTSEGEGSCVADCSAVQTCGNDATEGTEACDD